MAEINIQIKGAEISENDFRDMTKEVLERETVVIYAKNLKWRWWTFWKPKYLINPERIEL